MTFSFGDHAVELARMLPSGVETPFDRLSISTVPSGWVTFVEYAIVPEGTPEMYDVSVVLLPVPATATRPIAVVSATNEVGWKELSAPET